MSLTAWDQPMRREWITDNVRFVLTDAGMMIRDRAGESTLQWLAGFGLFALVMVVGSAYIGTMGHDLLERGLTDGQTGWKAYAEAIGGLLVFLLVVGGVMIAWARPMFGGHEVLELDGETVALTNVDFGVRWRKRAFARRDIMDLEYTAVGSSDVTTYYGIQFFVQKKRVIAFQYIKPDAAAEVIQAMRSFRSA